MFRFGYPKTIDWRLIKGVVMVVTIFFYAWMPRAEKNGGKIQFEFDRYKSWTCLLKKKYYRYNREECIKKLRKYVDEMDVTARDFKLQGTATGHRGFPINEVFRLD